MNPTDKQWVAKIRTLGKKKKKKVDGAWVELSKFGINTFMNSPKVLVSPWRVTLGTTNILLNFFS